MNFSLILTETLCAVLFLSYFKEGVLTLQEVK